MGRYVYHFEPGAAEGRAQMHRLLGVKGANLAEMARLGLNVPVGMTITTEACAHFLEYGQFPRGLRLEIEEGLGQLQGTTQKIWGDGSRPLLLSARSGGPQSMPGMMETVLNLGLTKSVMGQWLSGDEDAWFVHNCRRRLVQMYARVVFGIADRRLDACRRQAAVAIKKSGRSAAREEAMAQALERLLLRETGQEVPEDADEQLWAALKAIFRGWNAPRSREYRRLHGLDEGPGTAVTIMAMVFGNRDEQSASGIGFSRHPITGGHRSYGEYLRRCQGDVVAEGRSTPGLVRRRDEPLSQSPSLEEWMPGVCAELVEIFYRLERHFRAVQEVEFTVESGVLWLLQTRRATRTGPAAVRIALEMVDEGLIDEEEAISRVDPNRHVPDLVGRRLLSGRRELPASLFGGVAAAPGAASGRLVTRTAEAVERARRGESVVLVQAATHLDDVDALRLLDALVTTEGGMTAHLAEVSRKLRLPCVCGAREVEIAEDGRGIFIDGDLIPRGQMVTVDGSSGEVFEGRLELVTGGRQDPHLVRFLKMVDRFRRMDVRVAADELDVMEEGLGQGADGVGLCRTEPIITSPRRRMMAMRRVLLAGDEIQEHQALEELLHFHRHDLAQIFRFADGRPVTVRLLDEALQQFLPHSDAAMARTAGALDLESAEVERRSRVFEEDAPHLGLRGARLGVVYPEIYAMQIQGIVEACRMVVDEGVAPTAEILIPRVASAGEAEALVEMAQEEVARHLHGATGRVDIDVGVALQLPRAAMRCGAIATDADFVVFDLSELTRWCWGMAPEESKRYLPQYVEQGLVTGDPFATIDESAVAELMRQAIVDGRQTYGDLVVGVDIASGLSSGAIDELEAMEVDSLTVAPTQVVATRLAAAQAYIAYEQALRRRERRGLED